MNTSRLIGIIALTLAIGITALAGFFFAVQVNAGELNTGGLLLGAFIAFIVVMPIFSFGAYMLIRAGHDAARDSEMEQQRKLLDIVKTRGQIEIHTLAIELNTNVDHVKSLLSDLVGMQIFSGYVNWDKGILYSTDAKHLRDLKNCENCGAQISLVGKGVVACTYCGTEYFLP